MSRIIARIKGGLGNQLFCYAAARRLAIANGAELVIDDVTGFARDRLYRRQYSLDHFSIRSRKATPSERLEPFERYRRGALKWLSRRRAFGEGAYIEQVGNDFDERLLRVRVRGVVYVDGLWQSEQYFKDTESVIRDDLRVAGPADTVNQSVAAAIRGSNAVAVHVRWFDAPGEDATHNASTEYYQRAIATMEMRTNAPRYFVFSDQPEITRSRLSFPDDRVTYVSHNHANDAYADLWLMTRCRHFITANSTFSWWGAWLAGNRDKVVLVPSATVHGKTAWGFTGLIPPEWQPI